MKKTIIDQMLDETRQSNKETLKLSQIDEAAIALFSEKGFANTSTKEIANKANVAEGTIFRHYKTKDNLLLNILLKFMKFLVPMVKKDVTSKLDNQKFENVEDFLRFFLMDRIDFVKKNHDIFRIFVKELIYNDALRQNLLGGHLNEIGEVFYSYYDTFKAKGQLKNIENSELLNRMLKIFLADVIWVYILTDKYQDLDVDAWTDTLIRQYLDGVRQGGN